MRIAIVHAVPEVSSAFGRDHDGFTAAMEVIAQDHDVRWLNIHPYNADHGQQARLIPDADFVLVRSDWGWLPCAAADRALWRRPGIPVGLLIAGSSPPPPLRQMLRFDVLFYETPWYAAQVAEHPFTVEAMGVDTRWMRDHGRADRPVDWIMVGRLADWKRPERLIDQPGRRLAVGDCSAASPQTLARLHEAGIEVRDFVPYAQLADLYNSARAVFVPCPLQGGGERAVLEGRACGCEVTIADDNPKLASLVDVPVRSHTDYAGHLLAAIDAVVAGRRIPADVKLAGQRAARRAVLLDKARRAPSTVVIRARNLAARRPR